MRELKHQRAKDIHRLTTVDLINSITEICRIRSPFLRGIRMSNLGYYNWVLVDFCRRMEVVHQRFNREYKNHAEKEIRNQIINVIIDFDNVKYYIDVKGAFKVVRNDGDFFDLFPPFVAKKRTQILRVASIIGDEICAFTESIDMKEIGDMDTDEYADFLNDLKLSKGRLKEAIDTLQDANAFHGDPTSSYSRVELLNEKVSSSHECAYQAY
ncbi:hypothetical protein BJV82DRAFT_573223 [Fennellomyces sp. T-0311]|nr:hypothetical protein BJV82DRAFT_573223 [Fennellomyces sp. T-0311]